MSDAKQTPLHERLESVPAALRCIVDHSPLSSSSYPIGALCHEAAAALRAQGPNLLLEWAVSRWRAEVEHRPLVNKNRRSLDDAWRQVIRWAGGDDGALIGPAHDELLASAPQASQPPQGAEPTGAMREVLQRCIAGIDHLSALARLWEPDHSSGSDRRGWVLAQDARDDARKLLAASTLPAPQEPAAWRYRIGPQQEWIVSYLPLPRESFAFEWEPLYASPAPDSTP